MVHHFRWFFRLVTCQAKNFTARVTNGWHDLFEPLKTYHGFTQVCWKSLGNLNHGRNLVRLEMRSQRQRPFPRVAGGEFETKCSFGMTSELNWILYKGPLLQLGESEVVEDSELRRKIHGIVFLKITETPGLLFCLVVILGTNFWSSWKLGWWTSLMPLSWGYSHPTFLDQFLEEPFNAVFLLMLNSW